MMAEITQKLGFDASGAISTITGMDNALRGLNTRLRAFNKTTGGGNTSKVVTGFAQIKAKADQASASVNKVNTALGKMGGKGAKDVQTITVSIGGLLKALAARTAVQAITRMTAAFGESADAAGKFQLAVAQISNIAKGPAGTIEALTGSLSDLAVVLGRDMAEVTEAAFEALQNDLGSTEETMRLLEGAASDLALVTGGTLTQAVNSISSVIKSFNKDISEADDIADIFFGAIDAGRITLEEFQSSLGRVLPLSSNLGIGFREIAGSIAAITQSGTNARVAQTQLRNVLQKLINPTKDLQAAFNQLGAATGAELIEKFGGLNEALAALGSVVRPGSQAFAKLFGTIRGNLGALNLLANDANIVTRIMKELETQAGRTAKAAQAINNTDIRRSQKAFAKFSDIFRQIGESTQKLRTVIVETFNVLVSSGDQAVVALIAIAGAAGIATIAFYAFGAGILASLGPIAGIAIGIGIIAALTIRTLEWADGFDKLSKKIAEAEEARNKLLRAKVEKKLKEDLADLSDQYKETKNDTRDFFDAAIKGFNELQAKAKETTDAIMKQMKSAVSRFSSGIGSLIDKIADKLAALKKQSEDFKQGSADIGQEIKDTKFEQSLQGLTERQKSDKLAVKLRKEILALDIASRNVTNDPKTAKLLKDREQRVRNTAKDLADSLKNQGNGRFGQEAANKIEIKALKAVQKARNNAAKATNKLLDEVSKKRDVEVKKLAEIDRLGKKLATLEPGSEAAESVIAEINDITASLDSDFFAKLNIGKELGKLIDKFAAKVRSLTTEFIKVRAGLQAALDEGPFKATVDLQIQDTGDAGLDANLAEAGQNPNAAKGLQDQLKIAQEYEVLQTQTAANQEKITGAITNSGIALKDNLNAALNANLDATGTFGVVENLKAIQQQISASSGANKAGLEGQLNSIEGTISVLASAGTVSDTQAKFLLKALGNARKMLENQIKKVANDKILNPEALQNAIQGMDRIRGAGAAFKTELNKAKGETTGITTGVNNVTTATSSAVGQANALTAAYRAAAVAAASIKPPAAAGVAYHGGRAQFRASGGLTRGQDTQLTALSKGEMVVNSRSTGKFFSQLQAINAGQSPQFRDKGGSVTNIGDINVNVSSEAAGSGDQLGRSIARELRREKRRQTSRF